MLEPEAVIYISVSLLDLHLAEGFKPDCRWLQSTVLWLNIFAHHNILLHNIVDDLASFRGLPHKMMRGGGGGGGDIM